MQLIWGNPEGSGNWNGEEMGSEWGGNGEGEVSLRATWDQVGWDRITQKEGFQVSKRDLGKGGIGKGKQQRKTSKGNNKRLLHKLSIVIYVRVS
jgi:hypothetical protein